MIETGDVIILNGDEYTIENSLIEGFVLLNKNYMFSGDKIFRQLGIEDTHSFYMEHGLLDVTKKNSIFGRMSHMAYKNIRSFPPIDTLVNMQKFIDLLNEIIPYGSYKGYQRAQKLKMLQ